MQLSLLSHRMAPFGQEWFPKQYPATIDEWADTVEGDAAKMAMFCLFLQNTNEVYEEGECIPFTDTEPFSIY